MFLEDVEREIQLGDLMLFRGRPLYSRVIQRLTRSVYSHVGIVHRPCTAGTCDLDVLEAFEGAGVRTHPLRSYLAQGIEIDWFRITDPGIDRGAVVRWAWHRRGQRYASKRQLLRSFVYLPLCQALGIDTRVDHGRWFCSFLAAEALLAGGWRPPAGEEFEAHLTAPGGVALFPCLQRRGTLRLRGTP